MALFPRVYDHLAYDVRLPTTRGTIGLISLKDRPLSPVAKLFAQSVAPVLQDVRPKRTSRAAQKSSGTPRPGMSLWFDAPGCTPAPHR